MSQQPTSKDFAAQLHTIFRVEQPEALDLELVDVSDQSTSHFEQFSILFHGPASPWLPQGIYALAHSQMQEVSIFLVPLGPNGGVMRYEAVFSRLMDTAANG